MAKSKPRRKGKKRDYKAEYARRIARATERGISKSVARGHAGKGKAGIRLAKILGIEPGTPTELRPRQPIRHYVPGKADEPTFEERLERAGFGSWIIEQRRRVLRRETLEPEQDIRRISTSQEDFVQVLVNSEHSEREAYTQWFSPR